MESVTLTLDCLQKTYPNGQRAVQNVSLEVAPGHIFGLIGPNGAGKSTLLKLASGLLNPDSGNVLCGKHNVSGRPREAARFVGLMPDPLGVYTDVTSRQYLEFFARLLEIPLAQISSRIAEVVEQLELGRWLDAEVETLSAGWQRRLALGRVLLLDAPILLLDEPAAGLDISARQELLMIIRSLGDRGHTLIVSSHILPELEDLADTFGVLNDGAWVEIQSGKQFFTREEIHRGFGQTHYVLSTVRASDAATVLKEQGFLVTDQGEENVTFVAESRERAAAAVTIVVQRGLPIFECVKQRVELNVLVQKLLGGVDHAA